MHVGSESLGCKSLCIIERYSERYPFGLVANQIA